jgi:hypothetical protein
MLAARLVVALPDGCMATDCIWLPPEAAFHAPVRLLQRS